MSVPCLYTDCPCSFKTFNGLRAHLSRQHVESVTPREVLSFSCQLCSSACFHSDILSIFWGGLKWLHVYSKAVASVQTYIQPLLLIDTENILHMALKTLKRKSWQNTNCSDPTVTQIESVCGGWSSGWSWAFGWVARGFGSGHKGEVWPPVTKIREYFQCAKQVY